MLKLPQLRPDVSVRLPARIHPGERLIAEVSLATRRALAIKALRARLVGTERLRAPGRAPWEHRVVDLEARLAEATRLAAGTSTYRASFPLPASAPPSHPGRQLAVDYTLAVRVELRWWLDHQPVFGVPVTLPPTAGVEPGPSLHSTHPGGTLAAAPHLELSLESSAVCPGTALEGALALYHVERVRYREIELDLVAYERSADGAHQTEVARYRVPLDARSLGEGEAIPWRLGVPMHLWPSFVGRLGSLCWVFSARCRGQAGEASVLVPITVVPAGSELERRPRGPPPMVGSRRLGVLWEQVGQSNDLALAGDALVGVLGAARLRIARVSDADGSVWLEARATFAPLWLDIRGGPAGMLRRVLGGGVEVGMPDWDRRHHLTGRDRTQVEAFCKLLAPALTVFELAELGDEQLIVRRQDPGHRHEPLARFVADAIALARALSAAARAIPPPAAMAAVAPAWRRLGERLGTELETARMAVRGRHEGAEVSATTEWSSDGEPLRTVLCYHASPPFPADRLLRWNEGEPRPGELEALPRSVQARLGPILAGALGFEIAAEQLVLCIAAPCGDDRLIMDRFEQLLALAASLRGGAGPYR